MQPPLLSRSSDSALVTAGWLQLITASPAALTWGLGQRHRFSSGKKYFAEALLSQTTRPGQHLPEKWQCLNEHS